MKSFYYQFVNFIQGMPSFWFYVVWAALVSLAFMSMVKFYKKYTGEQKSFEKLNLFFISCLAFALVVYLTYIRF